MTDKNTTPEPEAKHENIEVPAQVLYGVSIFQCDDDHPIVHVTGEPDLGQLQRILVVALANMQADIIATKVVQKIEASKSRIIRPGG
ncbi:hypothetical protein DRO27_03830 [Candidatus Bathyarchaeota archaeon]|nr:MAG: hypothetical protein DRO27_03830 [Candidatus Bathyarchaeota archaeon]